MSMSLTKKARTYAALLVVCTSLIFSLSVAAQVTLYPSASPTSAQAGVQIVSITGFGFPDGNIHPTDVR
ncbi:MAG TPA: hypothetical protein VFP40_14765, partial [Terriglobales bacterium]|nr:hypothetical protein [Terriglobales bacterium]